MRKEWLLAGVMISTIGISEEGIPDRPPDVVSQRANIEDYYVLKNGVWVWSDTSTNTKPVKKIKKKKLKAEVILGKPTIRWIKEGD